MGEEKRKINEFLIHLIITRTLRSISESVEHENDLAKSNKAGDGAKPNVKITNKITKHFKERGGANIRTNLTACKRL